MSNLEGPAVLSPEEERNFIHYLKTDEPPKDAEINMNWAYHFIKDNRLRRTAKGLSLLGLAVMHSPPRKYYEPLILLKEAGADFHSYGAINQKTGLKIPLLVVAMHNMSSAAARYKIIEFLLENGADPNFQDSYGNTAFDALKSKVSHIKPDEKESLETLLNQYKFSRSARIAGITGLTRVNRTNPASNRVTVYNESDKKRILKEDEERGYYGYYKHLSEADDKKMEAILANMEKTKLDATSKKQLDTIKRIFTMLTMRHAAPAKYQKNMEDYGELLRTDFFVENKKTNKSLGYKTLRTLGRFVGTVAQKTNTFKVYRNAAAEAAISNAKNALNPKSEEALNRQSKRDAAWRPLLRDMKVKGNAPTSETNALKRVIINPLKMKIYNEVLGMILVLIAKAENKFQSESRLAWLAQRSAERLKSLGQTSAEGLKSAKSYLTSFIYKKSPKQEDEEKWQAFIKKEQNAAQEQGGIYSLSKIDPEFTFGILARGKVRDMLDLQRTFTTEIKGAKDLSKTWKKSQLYTAFCGAAAAVTTALVLFLPRLYVHEPACPNGYRVAKAAELEKIPRLSNDARDCVPVDPNALLKTLVGREQIKEFLPPFVDLRALGDAFTPLLNHMEVFFESFGHLLAEYVPVVVTDALIAGQTFGVMPAARLTYLIINGHQKTGTFKNEFIELHRILFDKRNADAGLSFDDAVESGDFTMYNQLSDDEKMALKRFKMVFEDLKPTQDVPQPTQEEVMIYLSAIMMARQKELNERIDAADLARKQGASEEEAREMAGRVKDAQSKYGIVTATQPMQVEPASLNVENVYAGGRRIKTRRSRSGGKNRNKRLTSRR